MPHVFVIGVDIGGTNTRYGLVNEHGEILARGHLRTDGYPDPVSFVAALSGALKTLIAENNAESIRGIGIGAPNGNYYTGTIDYAPNLRWQGVVPLAQLMTDATGIPCTLTNDANAAAMGELAYGAARGMKDFIVITLGTGVGGGVVSNGQLIYGHDGFAGELGHITVIRNGRMHWATGRRGALECYASATGIVLSAKEALAESAAPSSLRSLSEDGLTAQSICEAALAGDALSCEVFRYTGEVLGMALADFITFTSPEAIILFGGVTAAGHLLMQPAREHMEQNLLPIFRNKVKLLFSELGETDAAILGASALAWEARNALPGTEET